ncbi:LysR substrate-binding domain-containing protein [Achromobacter xylosoxidans]|uniref:LysR substrate-binding domain-containing protein n=1 Tax=Alcaligenes xylosoxydans xylosoxydans TaxID=85698 RepID=UPI001F131BD7|nr:LysR substrate-binding domain-containing protein [Achromobacter xylosoxidans]
MNNLLSNDDLQVFCMVARKASFAGVAEELGVSPGYVSKRVSALEAALAVRLLHRTTRRVMVTEDGERVYRWATRILTDVDNLIEEVTATRRTPQGLLRVCSSFGLGRNLVGPALSELAERYPALQIRFDVFDRRIDIVTEGFDLDIRAGTDTPPHFVARKLAENRRILCAAPHYLASRGVPRNLADLSNHDCLAIKEPDQSFGVWRMRCPLGEDTIKVTGPLSSNNGEIVLNWAVAGRGVMLRSEWDSAPLLTSGKLVRVLPDHYQEADLWAVYPSRLTASAKVRVTLAFLEEYFRKALAQT